MKPRLLFAPLILAGSLAASALTNQSLIFFQSDFRNSTVTMPLGDWTSQGDGKTAKDTKIGTSDINLREFFPVGAPAYVPIELGDLGLIYCSNSSTTEGGNVSEWLISPAVDMSDAPENALLSFDVVAYGSVTQPKYEVYYSTTGNDLSDFTNKLYTGRQQNSTSVPVSTRKYISLEGISADSVYFAFVNVAKDAQLLGFKDIRVSEYELQMTNVTPGFVTEPGEYHVQLNLELVTPVSCEGFTAELTSPIFTEPQIYTTTKQLAGTYTTTIVEFEKSIPVQKDEQVEYTVTIRPHYEGATVSEFKFDITCTEGYEARCVEEEVTGTWCGYCVRGIAGLNQFSDEFGDRFIGIAVHGTNDPMRVDDYLNPLTEQSRLTGYPAAWFNRSSLSDPYSRELVESILSTKVGYDIKVKSVRFAENSGRVSVDYGVKLSYTTTSANIKALVVVTEDQVSGKTPMWNQTNYYSGTSRQTIESSYGENAWKYFEPYCTGEKIIPFTQMVYDHVAQGVFNSYYGGGAGGNLPSDWSAGQEQTFTLSFDMPYQTAANGSGVQNWKNTHMVVILVDAITGKILNADKAGASTYVTDPASIADVTADADFSVAACGKTIKVNAPAESSVSVVNALGYEMRNCRVGAEGCAEIDCSDLSGLLLIQVASGSRSYVKKLII